MKSQGRIEDRLQYFKSYKKPGAREHMAITVLEWVLEDEVPK